MGKWLLGRGAAVDALDQDGETPLFGAVRDVIAGMGRQKVELLLQYGARTDIRNHQGQMPIDAVTKAISAETTSPEVKVHLAPLIRQLLEPEILKRETRLHAQQYPVRRRRKEMGL